MRETGPVRFRYSGDQEVAKEYAGVARVQLGILKNLMSLNGLQQLVRRVVLANGVEMVVASVFGHDEIQIEAPIGLAAVNEPANVEIAAEEFVPYFWACRVLAGTGIEQRVTADKQLASTKTVGPTGSAGTFPFLGNNIYQPYAPFTLGARRAVDRNETEEIWLEYENFQFPGRVWIGWLSRLPRGGWIILNERIGGLTDRFAKLSPDGNTIVFGSSSFADTFLPNAYQLDYVFSDAGPVASYSIRQLAPTPDMVAQQGYNAAVFSRDREFIYWGKESTRGLMHVINIATGASSVVFDESVLVNESQFIFGTRGNTDQPYYISSQLLLLGPPGQYYRLTRLYRGTTLIWSKVGTDVVDLADVRLFISDYPYAQAPDGTEVYAFGINLNGEDLTSPTTLIIAVNDQVAVEVLMDGSMAFFGGDWPLVRPDAGAVLVNTVGTVLQSTLWERSGTLFTVNNIPTMNGGNPGISPSTRQIPTDTDNGFSSIQLVQGSGGFQAHVNFKQVTKELDGSYLFRETQPFFSEDHAKQTTALMEPLFTTPDWNFISRLA
jgi:hypothetical protein